MATQALLGLGSFILRFGLTPSVAEAAPQPSWAQRFRRILGAESTVWEEARMTKEPFANELLVFVNAPNQKDPR